MEPWPIWASSWDFWPAPCAAFEDDQHPLARGAGGVEGAALDQRLDRALVHGPGVHALAEVPQRRERAPLLARALDLLHGGEPDALHGVQPEADVAFDDDELVV
jgi:hypothetical protein